MRDRITLLHNLLAPDGSLFVHIDDNELGYLLVLIDQYIKFIWIFAFRDKKPAMQYDICGSMC